MHKNAVKLIKFHIHGAPYSLYSVIPHFKIFVGLLNARIDGRKFFNIFPVGAALKWIST